MSMRFTSTHEWVIKSGDEVLIGITDHAQELLGDLVYVELPEPGLQVSAGDELGVVESVKAASDFYAPIAGEVIAVNEEVSKDPALVNNDPLHKGWLVRLKPHDLQEMNTLLTEEEYQNSLNESH